MGKAQEQRQQRPRGMFVVHHTDSCLSKCG
jgi:hypothetical protein